MPLTCGYSRFALETVLGVIGMVVFIAAVIGLAAGMTYLIVKISPSTRRSKAQTPTST
jgi:hypothetical protein